MSDNQQSRLVALAAEMRRVAESKRDVLASPQQAAEWCVRWADAVESVAGKSYVRRVVDDAYRRNELGADCDRRSWDEVRKLWADSGHDTKSTSYLDVMDATTDGPSLHAYTGYGFWYVSDFTTTGLLVFVYRDGSACLFNDGISIRSRQWADTLIDAQWWEVKRCGYAWAKFFDLSIIDPDGWRKGDGVSLESLITVQDFAERYAISSCCHGSKGPKKYILDYVCRGDV